MAYLLLATCFAPAVSSGWFGCAGGGLGPVGVSPGGCFSGALGAVSFRVAHDARALVCGGAGNATVVVRAGLRGGVSGVALGLHAYARVAPCCERRAGWVQSYAWREREVGVGCVEREPGGGAARPCGNCTCCGVLSGLFNAWAPPPPTAPTAAPSGPTAGPSGLTAGPSGPTGLTAGPSGPSGLTAAPTAGPTGPTAGPTAGPSAGAASGLTPRPSGGGGGGSLGAGLGAAAGAVFLLFCTALCAVWLLRRPRRGGEVGLANPAYDGGVWPRPPCEETYAEINAPGCGADYVLACRDQPFLYDNAAALAASRDVAV